MRRIAPQISFTRQHRREGDIVWVKRSMACIMNALVSGAPITISAPASLMQKALGKPLMILRLAILAKRIDLNFSYIIEGDQITVTLTTLT